MAKHSNILLSVSQCFLSVIIQTGRDKVVAGQRYEAGGRCYFGGRHAYSFMWMYLTFLNLGLSSHPIPPHSMYCHLPVVLTPILDLLISKFASYIGLAHLQRTRVEANVVTSGMLPSMYTDTGKSTSNYN